MADPATKSSATAKMQAARLAAVQGLYEYSHNKERHIKEIAADYAAKNQVVDGQALVPPDAELLKKILFGAVDRFDELDGMVRANLTQKPGIEKNPEPLLKAIMVAGAFEILSHQDIDFPIIINDYVNVAHAFYEGAEPKLVNAVLDSISRHLRG